MSLLLQSPFTMVCSGATSSGKTYFVRRILENSHRMMSTEPNSILYCYGSFQPTYDLMEREFNNISFMEGLPTKSDIDNLAKNGHSLIVLDDLMNEVNNSPEMQRLFTQYSHHQNISVIFVSQNIYFGGKYGKTINLNCHYLVLFRNPNLSQIRILGQQLLPGKAKLLTQAYRDATAKRYGYLFIDLHPNNDRDLMLRTNIFPEEDLVLYQEKL